ncbi:hypothetical protein [Flavobacterium sp. J27]|uniref:hypothetical protein n=1 Tax=Flavobacterium sp. J27 TaxID=2060419 RepID=UPI00102F3A38|nr:hypothetical protein [Flavobacterium sp. J27]
MFYKSNQEIIKKIIANHLVKLVFIMFLLLFFSCKDNTQITVEPTNKSSKKYDKKVPINFDKYKIGKGNLGPIKIGMSISEAEKELVNLTKMECDAFAFGYDGGSKSYLYYWEDQHVLALITKADSEEILVIIAVAKNIKTTNGLTPNATVKEIQAKYPNIEVNLDLMMDWEYMHDEKNNWDFIFTTEENNRIGKYDIAEVPSKPINTEAIMSWITIK